MEDTRITWARIGRILRFSQDKLLKLFILPSLAFAVPDPFSEQGDPAAFIAGNDLKLSLKILEAYCASAIKAGPDGDGSSATFFCTGAEFPGLRLAMERWESYEETLSRKYGRRSAEYKSVTQPLRNLTKPVLSIRPARMDGTVLDPNACLTAAANEEFAYQLALCSVLASTWPVWELTAAYGQEALLDSLGLDRERLLEMLWTLLEAVTPRRITLGGLLDALAPCTQTEFLKSILKKCAADKDYKNPAVIGPDTFQFSKSDLSRLFNGKLLKRSKDFLKLLTMPDVAKEPFSGQLLRYPEYPCLRNARAAWEAYLAEHPDVRGPLEALLSGYYDSFAKDRWSVRFSSGRQLVDLIERLRSIQEKPSGWNEDQGDFFLYQLSVFTIVAATWAVWEKCSDPCASKNQPVQKEEPGNETGRYRVLLKTLTGLLFPRPDSAPQASALEEYTSDDADQLLEDAKSLLENSEEYEAAGEKLIHIICCCSSIASNETLGQAYRLLLECRKRGYRTPDWLGSAKNIEEEARYYGTAAPGRRERAIKASAGRSSSLETGYYYMKCSNTAVSSWVKATVPDGWKPLTGALTDSGQEKEGSLLPYLSSSLRFIFAEDAFEQNVSDALAILERLRLLVLGGSSRPQAWGKIELVIRCEQEKVSPLLDAACSFLDQVGPDGSPVFEKNPVRIHLLDEKKRAADLLYARHPLFYPLTLPRNKDCQGRRAFHLVILSDNQDISYAVWLIRQAFWLLPHTQADIASRITLLSPYYERIAHQTTSLCPGFAQFSKSGGAPMGCSEPIRIDDTSFPEIEYRALKLDSMDLETFVENEISSENLDYYVIDAASDFESIQLGMRIREISIRKALKKRQIKYYTSDETVIAARCLDPDYANLAKQLIVPKEEEHDNRWFNDYKLLAFGTWKELFSWDELTGGSIEFMSECIHLQYCTKPGEKYDYTKKAPDEFLWSYYRRFYNRDSSYAAAMSLPYRLYEAGVLLRPSEWRLNDPDAFWSDRNRQLLADRFSQIRIDESLYRWEHSRFCCYLLSTGWLPVSPELARYYMNHDVGRHTLQIARLHPCLCSWDDLVAVHIVLHDAYIGTEDAYGNYSRPNEKFKNFADEDYDRFQKLDQDSIRQTADLLRARPLPGRSGTCP